MWHLKASHSCGFILQAPLLVLPGKQWANLGQQWGMESWEAARVRSECCQFKASSKPHKKIPLGDTSPNCCCLVAQSCLTLCNPTDCSVPGSPVLHYLLEFAQTYVHWVSDAIQPSHPLLPPSPIAFNLSQHQGLFQWVGSSHQVAKVLELQLQHQSFQGIFWIDFLTFEFPLTAITNNGHF